MSYLFEVKLSSGEVKAGEAVKPPESDGHNNLLFELAGKRGLVVYAAGTWQSLIIREVEGGDSGAS